MTNHFIEAYFNYCVFAFKLRSIFQVDSLNRCIYFQTRSILQVDLLNLCIYVQTQKYTGTRFSKLMYFFPKLEVCLKYPFNIDVFIRWGTHLYMSLFLSVRLSIRSPCTTSLRNCTSSNHNFWHTRVE